MTVEKIIHENLGKGNITISLTNGQYNTLCNALYNYKNKHKDIEHIQKLYEQMYIIRDILNYGMVDDCTIHNITGIPREEWKK